VTVAGPPAASPDAAPDTLRLFVALTPAPEARRALAAAAEPLAAACGGAARLVAPDLVHLTLRFLGDTPASRLPALQAGLAAAAARSAPLTLVPDGAGAFPTPARPRVLWIGLAPDAGLAALAAAAEAACVAAGAAAESRAFRAHVTVARLRPGGRIDPAALAGALAAVRPPPPFAAPTLDLVASTLSPAGPRYAALARWPLGAVA
jgi:2'-5' RNA ligase